jgi:hypothetical protein
MLAVSIQTLFILKSVNKILQALFRYLKVLFVLKNQTYKPIEYKKLDLSLIFCIIKFPI